ncbi:DoxX family membrane protein [Tistrella mobilis]
MRRILQGYYRLPEAGDGWIAAGLLAALRLWLAWPFFHTGMLRVERWSTQTFLFGDIHPLPGVDPWIAALLTTTAELTLPVLLAAGLAGRLAGLGLAVMAATILLVVGQTPQGLENGISQPAEQIPWILAGLVIALAGPGRLALDRVIATRLLPARVSS